MCDAILWVQGYVTAALLELDSVLVFAAPSSTSDPVVLRKGGNGSSSECASIQEGRKSHRQSVSSTTTTSTSSLFNPQDVQISEDRADYMAGSTEATNNECTERAGNPVVQDNMGK